MTLPRTKSWSGPNHTGQVQVNLVENLGRRILTVSRLETLSPNFIRVYLTGDDLAEGFPYVHLAPTDHVKVLFPQPGTNEVVIPTRGPKGWVTEEGAPEPIMRDYTVRGWLPETQELILEFVVRPRRGLQLGRQAKVGRQAGRHGTARQPGVPQNSPGTYWPETSRCCPHWGASRRAPDTARALIVVEVANAAERAPDGARQHRGHWVLRDEAGRRSGARPARGEPAEA